MLVLSIAAMADFITSSDCSMLMFHLDTSSNSSSTLCSLEYTRISWSPVRPMDF